MEDIYYKLHNGVNHDFEQHINNHLLACYIDEVNMIMKINTKTYIERNNTIKRLFDHSFYNFPLYESIQLDNNEIYNLRLVSLPKDTSTSIHNHNGICFYKLLNHNDSLRPVLKEKKYFNYASNNDVNVISNTICNGSINVSYPNDYHKLTAQKGHCYSLHLYFHDSNMCFYTF